MEATGLNLDTMSETQLRDLFTPDDFTFGKKQKTYEIPRTPESLPGGRSDGSQYRRRSESDLHDDLLTVPGAVLETLKSSCNPEYRINRHAGLEQTRMPKPLPKTNTLLNTPRSGINTAPGKKELADQLNELFLTPEKFAPEDKRRPGQRRIRELEIQAEKKKKKDKEEAIIAAKKLRLSRRYPQGPLVQRLSPDWEARVNSVLKARPDAVITTTIGGTELRSPEFERLLRHASWLNDESINGWIEWVVDAANKSVQAESQARGEEPSTVPKFIAHNSFFFPTLEDKGPSSTVRLMNRKRAPGVSLMEVDSIFVPICQSSHWTIGVVRPIAKTIEYFDSMGGGGKRFEKTMRVWLAHQLGNSYVAAEWTVPNTRCAIQNNGYDCGVFVCTNALCVARGLDTSCYLERDMTLQRRKIAAVLINRGFVGEFAWELQGA
jgi:sentrin-specific protease 1